LVEIRDHAAIDSHTQHQALSALFCICAASIACLQVVRIRIPRQMQPTFLGGECYLRIGSSTKKATGPQIAAASKLFSQK
jgi:hypothetical protein